MNILEKFNRGGLQRVTTAGIIAAIVAIILGAIYLIHIMAYESTDDAFIAAHTTSISARVSGHVQKVIVNDNQYVQKDDVLVELDPRDFQVNLDMAKATLTAAQATVNQDQAKADKSAIEAARAEKDYNRYKQIYDANAGISAQQVDNALAAWHAAQAQNNADIKQVAVSKAKAEQAQAGVENAELKLSYTKVHAPQAGKVTKKSIEPGEFISAGQPVLSIVPPDVWVVANFKETQLEYMKPGQFVKIRIDAFSSKTFKGHIDSIQSGTGAVFSLLPPENATGNYVKVVQRVPVKIVFDEDPNDTNMLSPGMSVIPQVKVK